MASTTDPYNLGLGTTATNPYLGQANPNLQSIIDMTSKDLVNNYNTSTQPAYNAAMVNSGSFGNSGIQAANLAAQGQLQQNLGDNASKLRFNDYSQQQQEYNWQQQQDASNAQFNLGFGRTLNNDAFSQNQENLQTGMGLLGMLNSQNQQDIGNTANQQNTPLNYLTQFSQIANGLGGNGSTSTGTQGTSSSPLAGALGGAQLGNSFGNWWNQQQGGGNVNVGNGYSPGTTYTPDEGSYFFGGG